MGCDGCPKAEGDFTDKSLPRWRPVARQLARTRRRHAVRHLKKGHISRAARSLSPKPSIVCTCTGWTACRGYYLKGFFQYCPNCGSYRPC